MRRNSHLFGDLPSLFGRDFAIGFLLPVAFFIPVSYLVADGFGSVSIHAYLGSIRSMKDQPALLGATVFVFVLWFGGVTLLALNRTIIRIKEGYGRWNPAKFFGFIERRRFKALQSDLGNLDSEFFLMKELSLVKEQDAIRGRRSDLLRELAERFPDQEEYLLPTAFGNTIRAFEVYPRVIYGLDAIPLWPRLLMVMSEDVRALVDSAKAEMDFWLNLWAMSVLLVTEYLTLAVFTHHRGYLWLLLLTLLLIPISSSRSRVAAAVWGEMVKAAFDMHLTKLREAFQMKEEQDRNSEQRYWEGLSRALIYRSKEDLPPRSERHDERK
jgi:hypothetical protein